MAFVDRKSNLRAAHLLVDEELMPGEERRLRMIYNLGRTAAYPSYILFDDSGKRRGREYIHCLATIEEIMEGKGKNVPAVSVDLTSVMEEYRSVLFKKDRDIRCIGDLLDNIHKQTGIRFVAEREVLETPFTMDAHNLDIPTVLMMVLEITNTRATCSKEGSERYIIIVADRDAAQGRK
jgi:hypothetical protein